MNMFIQLSVVLALAAFASAGDDYGLHKGGSYKVEKSYGTKYFSSGRYYYGGVYGGKCGNDGLYYKNAESFVICSNGNAYVQPCAPGTRNSGHDSFHPGSYYKYSHFCDVNLNDYGYGAKHAHYGAPHYGAGPHYGAPAPYAPHAAVPYAGDYHEGRHYSDNKAHYGAGYAGGVEKHEYKEEKHYQQEKYQDRPDYAPYHKQPHRAQFGGEQKAYYEQETSYKRH